MPDSDWINSIASALLDAESALRAALRPTEPDAGWPLPGRPPHRTPTSTATPAGSGGKPSVTIGQHEARTLLRAALPQPVSASPLRGQHARMLAAVSIFSAHLLSLNDPFVAEDPAHALASAAQLLDELRAWMEAARWHQACRRSGVRWRHTPVTRVSIMPIPQQQTPAEHEQEVNRAGKLHPLLAMAESSETDPMCPTPARHRTRARAIASPQAVQDALDLAAATSAPPTADLVPLHPARTPAGALPLHPTKRQNNAA